MTGFEAWLINDARQRARIRAAGHDNVTHCPACNLREYGHAHYRPAALDDPSIALDQYGACHLCAGAAHVTIGQSAAWYDADPTYEADMQAIEDDWREWQSMADADWRDAYDEQWYAGAF